MKSHNARGHAGVFSGPIRANSRPIRANPGQFGPIRLAQYRPRFPVGPATGNSVRVGALGWGTVDPWMRMQASYELVQPEEHADGGMSVGERDAILR